MAVPIVRHQSLWEQCDQKQRKAVGLSKHKVGAWGE